MSATRILAVSLALLAAAGLVSAVDVDYGASIDSATTYGDRPSTTEDEWEQRLKVAAWVAVDFSPQLTLDAQVSYLFTNEPLHLVDVDFLTLSCTRPLAADKVLSWSLGRQVWSDPTALILDHRADGLSATLGTPLLRANLKAAYTGLVLKPDANVSMSAADLADKDDDDVFFAPSRVLAGVEVAFPELFSRQTPLLFFLAQFDLRDESSERINTQYSGAKISGPVAPGLYYDAALVLESGRNEATDEALLGLLGSAGARYFGPLASRFELRMLYGSGADGSLDAFLPVSAPTLALAWAPPLGNLMAAEASASVKPLTASPTTALRTLQLFARTLLLLTAVDPEYRGTLLEGGVNARPTSDLGLALKGGLWLPDGEDAEYAVKLEVSMAF